MLATVTALVLLSAQAPQGEVIRGEHGVPHVFSNSAEGAFYHAGYAVAQDRLYQMDLSRRSARGQLAALTGKTGVASDQDALRFGYTESEYTEMFSGLSPKARSALKCYADGVNAWIDAAGDKLPSQYGGAKPRAWNVLDSLAIGVNLARRFGRGGAGEIRNLVLLSYLQDKLKDKAADALGDILWQNDPSAVCTVSAKDDPFKGVSPFAKRDAGAFAGHLKLLPKTNLFELLPGIRLEEQSNLKEAAAELGVPYKWGSYCVVISKEKSATGVPLLMNGPQMGFSLPSVVHQMSISCPGYTAVGMDLPGLPGILVGHSKSAAWGVTSGVADTDDIFFVKLNPADAGQYWLKDHWQEFEVTETAIAVKGAEPTVGRRELSAYGPVVIKSTGTGVAYVRNSTLWRNEAQSFDRVLDLPSAKNIREFRTLTLDMNASFNLFAATSQGDIGWFYCGRVPLRSSNVDPRLPTPGDGKHDWSGTLPADRMPYVINPSQGFIANWNNKPVAWWPNDDTPLWGHTFRNEALLAAIGKPKLSVQDLEFAARTIAMTAYEPSHFLADLGKALSGKPLTTAESTAWAYLKNWDLRSYDGALAPVIYDAWFDALRSDLFTPKLGSLLSPATFKLVTQSTLTWNALHRKTKLDYLGGRKASELMGAAFTKAVAALKDPLAKRFAAGKIQWKGLGDVLYDNRGTYIQFVELWDAPLGRFVAPPGISEDPASPYYSDQRDLAAMWGFFPMLWQRKDLPTR